MKVATLFSTVLFVVLAGGFPVWGQKGQGHGNGHGNSQGHGNTQGHGNGQGHGNEHAKSVVYVKESHHPAPASHGYYHQKVKVYHPCWSKTRVYNTRWVYCPRYNFYWDNYNNMYLYISNGNWVRSYGPPGYYNLPGQRYYEIRDCDGIDYIQNRNEIHIQLYLR